MGSTDFAVAPPPDRRPHRVRAAVRVFGEVLITLGLVLLLFVFYEVYVTDWFTARKQDDASRRLDQQWRAPGPPPPAPGEGDAFARLHIPAFGPDYRFTVLEGTDPATLAAGPGHYSATARPGEQGNFAVAGHRIGKGAPFNDLDRLHSCDALVVETATEWYIYRVLPLAEEAPSWDSRAAYPKCRGVAPIGVPYDQAVGRRIVGPEQGEVIHPVPGRPRDTLPKDQQTRLITLTTCHPEFSAAQRLIVHGVLVKRYPKDPADTGLRPPELEER
ncbi:LPXTG-site transpeptidase (sortase) family protein [Saccharopolyspora erythraea NRRL 2338]|uniref:Sortase-like protein n=2 Tax=Saccharopolyspora erythraea TaxID=1836 RepID=A4F5R7_SACEN|nr:class E sortase [Saccharopolyspora erythraea]EQD87981.1 sortase [Saccharopolyspora erythraea D]PFG93191.1 LPXTG-site transpeptidase (sortase) family protein [Saccharopolyspora erythraea NRRL 2338]QRK90052.1 class E sortase [Saccharopolyspora erythraea]CAL99391.1 putative sortase-like protein [Saccharopolyspora erythraea NRRL 2338]